VTQVLKYVGDERDAAIFVAREILQNQSLFEGCAKVKDDEEDWCDCFDEGNFELEDGNVVYFLASE
jgi:hypothetical protein